MGKQQTGWALVFVGVALGLLGMFLWQNEAEHVEDQQRVDEFTEALGGTTDEIEANHAGAYLALGSAALAILSGVIFLATAPENEGRPDPPKEAGPRDDGYVTPT